MKIIRTNSVYSSLLGLSLGIGVANWTATGVNELWLVIVLWAGISLAGGALAYVLATRIQQTTIPPATIAAAGLPLTGAILSLGLGVPPLVLIIGGLGGVLFGLLLNILQGTERTLRFISPVIALLFTIITAVLWLNGQITVLSLWQMVAALAFPVIGLALYSNRPQDTGALFTLSILLLMLGVILGLFLHQMETGQLRLSDENAIILVATSVALIGVMFLGLANSSRVWLRPNLNMAMFIGQLVATSDDPTPDHLRTLAALYAGLPHAWRNETLETQLDRIPAAAWQAIIAQKDSILGREASGILEKCLRGFDNPHQALAVDVFARTARQPDTAVWQPAYQLLIRHSPTTARQIARTAVTNGDFAHITHYLAYSGWKNETVIDIAVDALFRTPAEQTGALKLFGQTQSLNETQTDLVMTRITNKLNAANVKKLRPLLDDPVAEVRAMTREIMHQGYLRKYSIKRTITLALSDTFHTLGTGAGEAMALLATLDHDAATRELEWAQNQSDPTRAQALSHLAAVLPIKITPILKAIILAEGRTAITTLLAQPGPELRALVLRQVFPERYTPHRDSEWLARAAAFLNDTYGIAAHKADQITRSANEVLRDQYFAFVMRPEQAPKDTFHLEEMVSEPDDLITASHITTWFYEANKQIKDVVIAGHANAAVCKAATAKIMNAILDLPEDVIQHALVVTGAGHIRVTEDVRKPDEDEPERPTARTNRPQTGRAALQSLFKMKIDPPLQDLRNELQGLHSQTGLVSTQTINGHSYNTIYDELRAQIIEAAKTNEPCVLQRGPNDASRPLFMPYFRLNDSQTQPLTFTLAETALERDQYRELLAVHQEQLKQEMVHDAERRKKVYQEWRERDQESLERLTRQMVKAALPAARQSMIGEIAQQYIAVLMQDPVPELPIWEFGAQWADRELAYQTRLQRFYNFVRSHARRQQIAPITAVSAEIQNPNLPVSGVRIYTDATIQPGEVTTYVSMQEVVEWRLPFGIHRTDEWIERMDKLLLKFDPENPNYEGKRLDAINLGVFLDAFLRGWPPVFIQDPKARELYNQWSALARKSAWHHIYAQLREQQIHMLPLQSENVVFDIRETSEGQYTITPYFLAESQRFTIVVNAGFGIPYYVNLWQHRSLIKTTPAENRADAQTALEIGLNQLAQENPEEAAEHFKAALRTQAALAAETIFTQAYSRTTREAVGRTRRLVELTHTMRLYATDTGEAVHKLRQFNERHPNFLPDPYLLIAYFEAEQANTSVNETIRELQDNVTALTDEIDFLLETLVDEDILIPEPSSSGNTRYRFNGTQEEVTIHIIQQKIEAGEPLPEDHINAARQIMRWRAGGLGDGMLDQYSMFNDEIRAILQETGIDLWENNYSAGLLSYTTQQDVDEMNDRELMEAFLQLPNRLRTLNQLQAQREEIEETLRNQRSLIWEALQADPPELLRQAMALDHTYVTRVMQTRTHLGIHSDVYLRHVAPLSELEKADEAFRIQNELGRIVRNEERDLFEALKAEDDNKERRKIVREVAQQVLDVQASAMLPDMHQQKMTELYDYLKAISIIDTMTQGSIRQQIDSAIEYYLDQAYRGYRMVANVAEVPEARKQLSHCERLRGSYRAAIQRVMGDTPAPLMVGYPQTEFTPVNAEQRVPARPTVVLDPVDKAIKLQTARSATTILRYDTLLANEIATLTAAFADPKYATRLKTQQTSAAYSLLLAPVTASPVISTWHEVLQMLEPWLIRVIAYAGISTGAIDDRYRDEVLGMFDAQPVVTGVEVDAAAITTQILRDNDLESIPIQEI